MSWWCYGSTGFMSKAGLYVNQGNKNRACFVVVEIEATDCDLKLLLTNTCDIR